MVASPEDIIQRVFDAVRGGLRMTVVAAGGQGVPEPYSGTVDTTGQALAFSGPTRHLIVFEPGAAGRLEVSFDGGSAFMPVPSGPPLSIPCRTTGVHVRASKNDTDYAVLAMIEEE